MTAPPYAGPIWRERPTVLHWIALPFIVVAVCIPLGLFALASCFVPDMSKGDRHG